MATSLGKAANAAMDNPPAGRAVLAERPVRFPKEHPTEPPWRSRHGIAAYVKQAIVDCARGHTPWPLLFHGEAGSGKTCAGLCVVDHYGGWYQELPEWCVRLIEARLGESRNSAGYRVWTSELWSYWRGTNLCVLDEVGTRETVSDHHFETLKKCLDLRLGKPLIVISNHGLKALAHIYDDRIASRLSAGTIVEFEGDRRNRKE